MATTDRADEVGSGDQTQTPSLVTEGNQLASNNDYQTDAQVVFWTGATAAMPEQLGRYRIKKRLGVGGMGAVFLVENTELQREEALKVPHFESGSDPGVRERFLREARSAAKLDHPNLCSVLDAGEVNGICFLTMRYLSGKPLSDYVGQPLPPRKAVEIVAKLAEALDHAHEKGVIHRDLKPSNVMLCPGTGPTVMDFGLAKQILQPDQKLTRSGMMLGTPGYMPPEQVKGELNRIGPASDIYSLGVIFFELLTGRLPFSGTTGEILGKILYTEAPLPSQLLPGVSPVLDALCQKAMAKEPEARYPSMKAFAGALLDILQTMPTTADAVTSPMALPISSDTFQAPAVSSGRETANTLPPETFGIEIPPVTPRIDVSPSSARGYGKVVWLGLALLLSVVLIGGAFRFFGGWPRSDTPRADSESAVRKVVSNSATPVPAPTPRVAGEPDASTLRTLFQMGRPHVVLVGVKDYADKQIRSRPLAEDDARAFYDLVTDPSYLGADKERVKLLLGSEDKERGSQPATRDNILAALRWVAANAKNDDPVILAFFVQGAMQGEKGHLLAADSTLAAPANKALLGKDVTDALAKLRSQRVAVFLDVDFRCWPDSDGSVPAYSINASPYDAFLGDDGTGEHRARPGRALFLASDGRSPSPELERNGAFADVVLRGLRGEADGEGAEPDGLVSVTELFLYLDRHLPGILIRHGKNDFQKNPTHICWVGRDYHFPLTINAAVAETAEKRLRRFDEVVKSQKIPQELAREGNRLLLQLPRRKDEQELRTAYAALAQGETSLADLQKKRASILEKRKLPADKAQEFADRMFQAIQEVEEKHVYRFARNDLVSFAIRGLFESGEERLPDAISKRLKQAGGLAGKEVKALFTEARLHLGAREELVDALDVDIALNAMLRKLDAYSAYISPKELAAAERQFISTFTGIGVYFQADPVARALRVVTPYRGSPAYHAGIRAGDLITTIIRDVDNDGKALASPEVTSTKELTYDQAMRYIEGKEGTKVRLTIQRVGQVQPIEIEVARGQVKDETVVGFKRKADDSWHHLNDDAERIAYVRLTSFKKETADDLSAVMADLTKQKVRGLILDLRDNTGGVLASSIQVAGLFIKDGIIATLKSRDGNVQKLEGKREGRYLDIPMVCLVNRYTASGAETVAAALQDHKRCELFGEQTFGNGCIQHLFAFHGGQLKLTTQLVYRPSGQTFHRPTMPGPDDKQGGVKPDEAIKLTPRDAEAVRDWYRKNMIIDAARPAPVWPREADSPLRSALANLRKKLTVAR